MTFRIPEDLDPTERQNFIDALNWYKQNPTQAPLKFVLSQRSRERVVRMGQEFGIDVYPGTPGPAPTPDPANPLARIDATTSQWSKYAQKFLTEGANPSTQMDALLARYPDRQSYVHEVSAFYDTGGIGNISGRRDGNNYWFFPREGGEIADVNGAADAYIAAEAAKQGKTVPQLG